MKRPVGKALVLVTCISVMLITGCGEKEPPSVKKSRAIAAENMELRKELEQRDEKIQELRDKHDKEMKKQEDALAKCLQEKETWKKKSEQNVRDQVKGVLDTVLDENKKLREENEKLKAQIDKLNVESEEGEESVIQDESEEP